MTTVSSRHPVIKELLDAFGLPTDGVSAFNLNILPDEPVTISVQFYAHDKKLGKVPGIIKRFRLVEIR